MCPKNSTDETENELEGNSKISCAIERFSTDFYARG
jgi:hypothetical protein